MAKDAKGHGSEKRSGNTVDATYSSRFGIGGLGKGMYARTADGRQYKLNPIATDGMIPRVGSTINPDAHALVSGGQPVASNASAAATLASGSKSAPVDTHPAMVESKAVSDARGNFGKGSFYDQPSRPAMSAPTPAHGYIKDDPGNHRYRNGQKMPTDL